MIPIYALIAAVSLAVVVYQRTPEKYEASASLMIRQAATNPKLETSLAAHGLLSSYRQLLLSDTVLLSTVEALEALPPELSRQSDRAKWPVTLRSMLHVSFSTDENILHATCRSEDAASTVRVLDALTTASAAFMENYQQDVSLELVARLDNERRELRDRLFSRERELLDARKACGDINLAGGEDEPHPAVLRMTQLTNELTTVRKRRLELQAMLSSVEYLVRSNADLSQALQKLESIVGAQVLSRVPGHGGQSTETVRDLEAELEKMVAELSALSRHYGQGHAEIARRQLLVQAHEARLQSARGDLRNQIRIGLRDPQVGQWMINTLASELMSTQQYETSLLQEYTAAENYVLSLSDRLADIEAAEREVDTLRQLHTSLLNRLNAIDIEQGGGAFRVAVLTEPLIPHSPVYPILSTFLFKYVAAAIVLSLLVIYVLDMLDDRLRSPEQIREQLQLPVLGITRKLPLDEIGGAGIYVHRRPQSVQSEAYRTLRTALSLAAADTHCIAITSTEMGEGKSTLTANLGAAFAQTGKRTLLIDADMRRPGLSRELDVRGLPGLSEVLREESQISERCRERVLPTEVPRLDILPCGPRIQHPGMLLSMPSLGMILDWAISEYDQVLVDCPPTLAVSDAAIVSRYADGLLFLISPSRTHRRGVLRAVQQLRSMGATLLGAVVNAIHDDHDAGYEGYGYGYGYGYDSKETYGDDTDVSFAVTEWSAPPEDESADTLLPRRAA